MLAPDADGYEAAALAHRQQAEEILAATFTDSGAECWPA